MHHSSFARKHRLNDPLKTIGIPSPSARAVIINIPGYKGDIHGYNQKYDKIGTMLAAKSIGAFVLMPNRLHQFDNDYLVMVHDLEAVIRMVSHETRELCAVSDADIYLMGTSAGAAGVAAVAGRFPQVKKVLLIAPYFSSEQRHYKIVEKSIGAFVGEVSITVGADDTDTGVDAAQRYFNLAQYAKERRMEIIPDCGHRFEGEKNGMILSKAPLWAFAGDTTFPSPKGGLVLY